MRQHVKRKWLAMFLVFTMMIGVCSLGNVNITAHAADIRYFQVTGTYRQTEARTMLAMINRFRTGSDAWQWNENNTEKVQVTGLSELQYDYNLENIAMQRAMELVVGYSHTRPNGENCFSVYTGEYSICGENIAIGTSNLTADEAFELWQETNEPFEGQGHRRNMLSDSYDAVGIAHVYYEGCHYWVQEFGDRVVFGEPVPANDAETTVAVPVSTDRITELTCNSSIASYQLEIGKTAELPVLSLGLRTYDTWSYAPSASAAIAETPVWEIRDTDIASMSDNHIAAIKPGLTSLIGMSDGQTIEIPIKVVAIDLRAAVVSLSDSSYLYDGKAKTPAVTVTYEGTVLTEGSDYTVTYKNNINAGTAKAMITGIGNYTGTVTKTFSIGKATNKISIKKTSYSLRSSKKVQTFTLKPKVTKGKITYTSSHAKVKVSKTGKVTIAKNFTGKATITIKVTDKNYKTATKKVVVKVKK